MDKKHSELEIPEIKNLKMKIQRHSQNAILSLFGVCILSLLFVSLFYGKILLHPNSYLFSADGDAMKNYYTYAYFIKNNHSNTNFEGMNYPYGEH